MHTVQLHFPINAEIRQGHFMITNQMREFCNSYKIERLTIPTVFYNVVVSTNECS